MTRGKIETALARLHDLGLGKDNKDGVGAQDPTQSDVLLSSVASALIVVPCVESFQEPLT
jgi:hypothetical protein